MPMPKLTPQMESAVLSKWLIKEGDEVSAGDLVCELEVEGLNPELPHATMLIETHEAGFVARLLEAEGSRVAADRGILVLCDDEASKDQFAGYERKDGPSPNSGSGDSGARVFCWQAYVKGPPVPGMG
uniref:Lipoyl-binding domain-containing protein n=1 Tax=Hemiselmis tepida TaxID=464990 RepID=A0A7S0YW53_9CRYP